MRLGQKSLWHSIDSSLFAAPPSRTLRHSVRRRHRGEQVTDETQAMVVFHRQDGLGMKLHAFHWQSAMTDAHNDIAPGRRHLENLWNAIANKRVVASHRQRRWQVAVDAIPTVLDKALFAVIRARQ